MQNVFWISFLHGGGERISANNNLELFGEKKTTSQVQHLFAFIPKPYSQSHTPEKAAVVKSNF